MKATELRVGNIVHSPLWGTDVIVDIENIGYHEDFIPLDITDERLIEMGFEKYNDNYTINTLHGYLTEKTSKMSIKYTACKNWVVTRPANRTIFLKSINELQNLYYSLTGKELFLSVKEFA